MMRRWQHDAAATQSTSTASPLDTDDRWTRLSATDSYIRVRFASHLGERADDYTQAHPRREHLSAGPEIISRSLTCACAQQRRGA